MKEGVEYNFNAMRSLMMVSEEKKKFAPNPTDRSAGWVETEGSGQREASEWGASRSRQNE